MIKDMRDFRIKTPKMPQTVEMVVSLKVPDTTAITALQTLQRIGFAKIKDVQRAEYYKFLIEGDADKFKNKICKVDILVNANKHLYDFSIKKNNNVKILVKSTKIEDRENQRFSVSQKSKSFSRDFRDTKNPKDFLVNINDDGSGILITLKNRLGFKNIKSVEKAVLWNLAIDADEKEARKIAEKAAKELLVNENYQEYSIIG